MLNVAVMPTAALSGPHLLAWNSLQVWIILLIAGVLVGFLGVVFIRCRMKAK
jgi:hypothetical protein